MRFKRFLIVILISIIALSETPKAIFTSNTYTEGVYDVSEIEEFTGNAELTTANKVTSLIIFDSSGVQLFYKRFDTIDEITKIGIIKNGYRIVVVGDGTIAITI